MIECDRPREDNDEQRAHAATRDKQRTVGSVIVSPPGYPLRAAATEDEGRFHRISLPTGRD